MATTHPPLAPACPTPPVDNMAYVHTPDPQIPLTASGQNQARAAGRELRKVVGDENIFFYLSPYRRSLMTFDGIKLSFSDEQTLGVREEVQLREQDFGNFQDFEGKKAEKAERLRFGRFYYRFPNGESGADVYDRMTLFEDHLIRDINAGRFVEDTNIVIVTHGLTLRIFLMRWFHWSVRQMLGVYNPKNAVPLVLERVAEEELVQQGILPELVHTKGLYRLTEASRLKLSGCEPDMCTTCADDLARCRPPLGAWEGDLSLGTSSQ